MDNWNFEKPTQNKPSYNIRGYMHAEVLALNTV